MTGPLLRLEHVSKSFELGDETVVALNEVDLVIGESEVVVVTGPSGSGKSTLLHVAAGLDLPDSGRVLFEEEDLASLSRRDAARFRRQKLGFVFQFFNLVPSMSALQNVSLPLLLDGASPKEADERALGMLEAVGLADRAGQPAGSLSGGQMQRVSIARALAAEPALVLADEPTGNLDSTNGVLVMEHLRSAIAAAGAALLLITHDTSIVRPGDRCYTLHDGALHPATSTVAHELTPSNT